MFSGKVPPLACAAFLVVLFAFHAQPVTALTVDIGPHGSEFCFERTAHEREEIAISYAVHKPRGAYINVHIKTLLKDGPVVSLYDHNNAEHGEARFLAPHSGSFAVCFLSGTSVSYVTSVSVATLVKGHNIQLDSALARGEVHGAEQIAMAAQGVVDLILHQQDMFREAVWRHDSAMYESGIMAKRASLLVCVLVFFASIMQVVFLRHLLTGKRKPGSGSMKRMV